MAGRRARGTPPIAVALEGGPWDRRWFSVEDWAAARGSATRMGHTAQRPAGAALGYHETDRTVPNPDPKAWCDLGVVWAWRAA